MVIELTKRMRAPLQTRRRSLARSNGGTRTFVADILDDEQVVVSNASVELWTRDMQAWHGQILFLACAGFAPGRRYVLATAGRRRTVVFLDVVILKGFCWVLFEQAPSEGNSTTAAHG